MHIPYVPSANAQHFWRMPVEQTLLRFPFPSGGSFDQLLFVLVEVYDFQNGFGYLLLR
jgi:hypothetical protein